jgi:hypothetical protein
MVHLSYIAFWPRNCEVSNRTLKNLLSLTALRERKWKRESNSPRIALAAPWLSKGANFSYQIVVVCRALTQDRL